MSEFNLDDFKEKFKNAEPPKKDAKSILQMLNKNSIDNVKYLFYISLVEFLIGLVIFILEMSSGTSNVSSSYMAQIPEDAIEKVENITRVFRMIFVVFMAISLGFIITFYQIYKNLRTDQTIKSFTKDIIKFRQKANYFIAYNVAVFILFWISFTYFTAEQVKYIAESKDLILKDNYMVYIYVISFVIFLLFFGLLVIYYRYFWGMFLGRLKRNQAELEELE